MPWWTIAFWTTLVAVAAYAFVRGGGPERAAAAALLAAASVTVFARSAVPMRYSTVEVGVLVIDVFLFAALVAIAVRSGRGWSICLAVLQAITLLGHLGKRLDPDLWRLGYAIMITGPAYPGLAALAIGTFRQHRRSRANSNAN